MRLVFTVILAHFLLLFLFTLSKPLSHSIKKPIVVKIEEPKPIVKHPIKEASSPPLTNPPVKKEEAKKSPPKKSVSTAKKTPAPPPASKTDELRKMMKEGLSKMDKVANKLPSETSSSHKIGKLQSESLETAYEEELAYFLKSHLNFPDIGELKLKVKIERGGKVKNCQILSSSSSKNKEEATKINTLTFPPFGNRFQGELVKEFSLHLNIGPLP